MAYDARPAEGGAIERAIDAFGRAIAINPEDALARLERGQILYRKGDFEAAKLDLAHAMRSPDPRVASSKPLVTRLLGQIAQRRDEPGSRDAQWSCGRHHDAIECRPLSR
jgi:tetratricopeptide (TPR) repeat protein